MFVSTNESLWSSAPKRKRKTQNKTNRRNEIPVFSLTQHSCRICKPTIKNERKYKSISKSFTRLVHRKKSLKHKLRLEGEKNETESRGARGLRRKPKYSVCIITEISVFQGYSRHCYSQYWDMGVARIFQKGGHTNLYRGYSSDCHLNIVGCLLTKRLTKGGSRAPQDPPWLRPCGTSKNYC